MPQRSEQMYILDDNGERRYVLFNPDGGEDEYVPGGTSILRTSVTTRILSNSDHGRIIGFTSSQPVAVTVPAGLREDFECTVTQIGSGTVTIGPGVGVTLHEPDSRFVVEKQYAPVAIIAEGVTNTFLVWGRTTA